MAGRCVEGVSRQDLMCMGVQSDTGWCRFERAVGEGFLCSRRPEKETAHRWVSEEVQK